MTVKDLTLDNFEEEVINSELPIIIDFYADWCGPCQMMKPVFAGLSEEYEGKLKFMKLDTQSEEGLAMKFGIQGIPALVLLKDQKEIGRIVGFMGEDQLRGKIDEILGKG
ncbi:MAG TPA: thioredoxin [Candidatus Nanoarchaeia archaeon]|nr:thioredoxin [Candidatus Nanoarchaeia archaeon]